MEDGGDGVATSRFVKGSATIRFGRPLAELRCTTVGSLEALKRLDDIFLMTLFKCVLFLGFGLCDGVGRGVESGVLGLESPATTVFDAGSIISFVLCIYRLGTEAASDLRLLSIFKAFSAPSSLEPCRRSLV